jgi:2-polyprenyl-6-methoxyphenol hydroxylase-like FAD-dependent oxidoreductase
VIIVGGGPVGLCLALCLAREGVACKVLEKRTDIDRHSKSLGIHPVSLELFDELAISEKFVQSGLKIFRGHAYADRKKLGTVSFENCPPPFNFILALPQYKTEEILQDELNRTDPGCLVRGATVRNVEQHPDSVTLRYLENGELKQLQASWVVGCDGKNSKVREEAGIRYTGKVYPDTYVMGDFTDNTRLESDAAVFLHRDGLVESFPLPDGMRRWVVKTDRYIDQPSRPTIERLINNRLNIDISKGEMSMISSFGVQHLLGNQFHNNRILLAGDSAHVVSPIGGQGMNLGWLTARRLSGILKNILDHPEETDRLLQRYSGQSRKVAGQVARRAEINMWLGRKQTFPLFRQILLRGIVNTPLRRLMARVFTMRGLGRWPI